MAGFWKPLASQPPSGVSTMLLLTDGTVMALGDDEVNPGKAWLRLSPDPSGDYLNGAWSRLAQMKNGRRYFASAVLSDGRVFIAGGEYSDAGSDLVAAEIYDPEHDLWTTISTPAGWPAIGDAPCCVLADGRLLLGSIHTSASALFDPHSDSWSPAGDKDDQSEEETWTLLRDGSVLTVECDSHPRAERYVPSLNRWVNAGTVPVDLVQASSREIGPALLMGNGTVFALGATGHTAIYTPPASAQDVGAWSAGPDMPKSPDGVQLGAKDAPACLLPNGRVLCVLSPLGEGDSYPGPSYFYESDGASFSAAPVPLTSDLPSFAGRLLLLPTGQALFANGSPTVEIYSPDGDVNAAWAPKMTSHPQTISPAQTFQLSGTQLNGISQAVSYGDDATMATNYPLVRVRRISVGQTWYCRTHGHSSMGVATGAAITHTNFTVPTGIPDGPADLEVVVNGIASPAVPVTVGPAQSGGGPSAGRGCAPRIAGLSLVAIGLLTVVNLFLPLLQQPAPLH